MGDEAEHLDFLNEIVHALVNVRESVDFPAGQMRSGCHQVLVFRPEGKLISEGRRIDMRPKGRMLGDILHTLPVVIDYAMKVFEALDVIFLGNDSFHFFSFSRPLPPLWGEGKGEGKFRMPLARF
jgi:hypothetical protein